MVEMSAARVGLDCLSPPAISQGALREKMLSFHSMLDASMGALEVIARGIELCLMLML